MRQSQSNLKYHSPRAEGVLAVRVTRENAEAVSRELGGRIEEEAKASDRSDVARWIVLPTLDGVKRLLITTTGPVVGREFASGRIVVWPEERDFHAAYKESTR